MINPLSILGKIFGINGLVHKSLDIIFSPFNKPFAPEYRPKEIYYRLICRLWYRFNTIHIKRLPATWHDPDTLLPEAVFQILVDFIELEKPLETIDTEHEYHKETWNKVKELYAWVKDLPNKEAHILKLTDEHFKKYPISIKDISRDKPEHKQMWEEYRKIDDMEHKLYEEMTEKAIEILKIRACLWV